MRARVLRCGGLRLLAGLFCLLGPIAGTRYAVAQAPAYPTRFVKFVVPFGPGGSADVLARVMGQAVGESWGQQIVIENKPGADTDLGSEAVAKAPADGYSLLVTTQALAVGASLRPRRPYKLDDLAPVALLGATQAVMAVPTTLPVDSIGAFVALAKAQPGKLDFGSTGIGTSGHLAVELFRLATGIDIVHVPFRNIGQQMTDLIAGRIALAAPTVPGAIPHVRGGKVKALAVTGARRSPAFADLPTVAEAGVAGYQAETWYALLAPRATSAALIERINQAFRAALDKPDVAHRIADLGIEPRGSTPAELGTFITAEVERWAKVVRSAKIGTE